MNPPNFMFVHLKVLALKMMKQSSGLWRHVMMVNV